MKLRAYREARGLSQEEIGKLINRSGVAVSRYESGERMPGADDMRRIFVATGGEVTPNDFHDLPKPATPGQDAA